MIPDIDVVQGDVPADDLIVVLKDGNGAAVDLTSAATIRFWMRRVGASTATIAGRSCTKVNPPGTDGKVRLVWQTGDFPTPGDYLAEFEVQRSGGKVDRFPSHRKLLIRVHAQIA